MFSSSYPYAPVVRQKQKHYEKKQPLKMADGVTALRIKYKKINPSKS